MTILGISAYYHDSSAAIVIDGKVVAAAQEERFSRVKHDSSFPLNACEFCLSYAKISIQDIDEIVFYEKPFLRFERILESMIAYAPKTIKQFVSIMPLWLKEKLNIKLLIRKELKKKFGEFNKPILFTEHHLAHAAIAYYTSGYKDSAILVMDAVGEWATTSLMRGGMNKIELLKEQKFPDSIGLLYSSFTYFLGFHVNSDEYKVMGLAPYGIKDSEETQKFIKLIIDNIVKIHENGAIELNLKYFKFQYGFTMINETRWSRLFGLKPRRENESILQTHCNLALAIQSVLENIAVKLCKEIKSITKSENICISGGIALNCAMNGMIKNTSLFRNIYIPCSPGDGGGSIGAALYLYYISNPDIGHINNKTPYLGPEYLKDDIQQVVKFNGYSYENYEYDELFNIVSDLIIQGKIVGWFQGRMEFGPRALGNRSIIADCRYDYMKDKINTSIKFREGFRPFAPVVINEHREELFNMDFESPYMMFTTNVKEGVRLKYKRHGDLNQEINANLSKIPAVTHIDYSARVQTLKEFENPIFYNLLSTYYNKTGCPALLNTSFNIMGEPIVCTPQDAINTFKKSGIEILVIGNILIRK